MCILYCKLQYKMALGGSTREPRWRHVGVKLASSGHLNTYEHQLSDEGRYKGGLGPFWGGSTWPGEPLGRGI